MALKPEQLVGALVRCLRAGTSAFVWGPPGIGKSAIIMSEIGPRLDLPVHDFRLNSKEPVDLRGLPVVDRDYSLTRWVAPEDLPTEPALIFFDEMNTAAPSIFACCYQIVQEHKLGNWRAHPNTLIIGAGNRESDRAVANKMPSALMTRLGHFELEPDLDQWIAWGLRTGSIDAQMVAYHRWRGGAMLFDFKPTERTSPIPRTWQAANAVMRQNPPESTRLEEIAAHVGEGAAVEFLAFCELWSQLPDVDALLAGKTQYDVPKGPKSMSVRFALAGAISSKMTRKNMQAAVDFLDKMGEEFSVFAMRDALARDKTLAQDANGKANEVFLRWGASHGDMLG